MVPRALAKQNHSWQRIKQKIVPEDKNTAGEKFKESKQMKIITGQFQRQPLGSLKGSKMKFRKGKAKAAKGSQLL